MTVCTKVVCTQVVTYQSGSTLAILDTGLISASPTPVHASFITCHANKIHPMEISHTQLITNIRAQKRQCGLQTTNVWKNYFKYNPLTSTISRKLGQNQFYVEAST